MKERVAQLVNDSTSAVAGSGVVAVASEQVNNGVPHGTGLLIVLAGILAPVVKEIVVVLIDRFMLKLRK